MIRFYVALAEAREFWRGHAVPVPFTAGGPVELCFVKVIFAGCDDL